MIIENKKKNDINSESESAKEGIRKSVSIAVNRIISITSHVFVVVWMGLLMLWTNPYLADYYQKMANSHYDTVQWCQMGPLFVVALFLAIHSFVNKRYFVGLLTIIIAIWSFYWAFLVGFSCHACTFGG